MDKRITHILKARLIEAKHPNFNWNDLLFYNLSLRKELLSDVLEYEDYLTSLIVVSFLKIDINIDQIRVKYLKKWCYEEDINVEMKNKIEYFLYGSSKQNKSSKELKELDTKWRDFFRSKFSEKKYDSRMCFSFFFDELEISSKIFFIRIFDLKRLETFTQQFKEINEELILSFLEIIKELRNFLSHNQITSFSLKKIIDELTRNLTLQKHLLMARTQNNIKKQMKSKGDSNNSTQYDLSKLRDQFQQQKEELRLLKYLINCVNLWNVIDSQFSSLHDNISFVERFEEKLKNNPKTNIKQLKK